MLGHDYFYPLLFCIHRNSRTLSHAFALSPSERENRYVPKIILVGLRWVETNIGDSLRFIIS